MTQKSSLAYIGEEVVAAAERQLRQPEVSPAEQQAAVDSAQAKVAGFVIHRGSVEKGQLTRARNRRIAAIEKFKVDSEALRAKLATVGITPLAMLPVGAWDRICDRTKLIRLSPDEKGRVRIDDSIAVGADAFAERCMWWTERAGGLAACAIVGTICYFTIGPWFWLIVASFIGYAVTKQMIGNRGQRVSDGWAHLYIWWQTFGSKTKLLHRLFPKLQEPVESTLTAQIALPKPPEDVQQILLRGKALNLKVALVPEALGFAEPIGKILAHEASNRIDARIERQRAEYLAWLEEDPIIYDTHESAVAIIAQFGEFPIEKQVVDEIVGSHQLIF